MTDIKLFTNITNTMPAIKNMIRIIKFLDLIQAIIVGTPAGIAPVRLPCIVVVVAHSCLGVGHKLTYLLGCRHIIGKYAPNCFSKCRMDGSVFRGDIVDVATKKVIYKSKLRCHIVTE
jgi:hypothetical protein